MSGLFPLATSVIALLVMFTILATLDLTIALLALSVVPFLYLCLRYYMNTLVTRTERVKELESKLIERLYEVFSAIRLVKSFARERFEADRYTRFGTEVMTARIAMTWQESLFAVIISMITILGTALVVVVGGAHVLQGPTYAAGGRSLMPSDYRETLAPAQVDQIVAYLLTLK